MGIQAAALWFKQLVTPTRNPAAGENFAYFKSDNKFYGKNSGGTEFIIGPGAAPGTHSHVEADLPTTLATDTEVATAITNHTGAADPHPGYLTPTEGNAAYSATGHTHAYSPTGHAHVEADLPATMATDTEVATAVSNHAAAADPHTGYQKESEKAAANGYASLDGSTKVPFAQMPVGSSGTTVAQGDHAHGGLAPALNIKDEGTLITGTPTGMNFVGVGVTVAGTPEPTITIPGVPIGSMMMWPATAAPPDWLLCDGTSYPNTSYPVLAAILRVTAAFVVDADNFRTPDLVRRVAVGSGVSLAVGRNDGIATQASRTFGHTHGAGGLVNSVTNLNRQNTTNVSSGSAGRLVGAADGDHGHVISGSTFGSAFDDIPNMCLAFIIRAV